MSFFKWDPKYDIGVQNMNSEHQKIIELMNRLHEAHDKKATKAEILKCVDELAKFTVSHFEHEEKFFDSLKFPEADQHKAIHKDLLKKLTVHRDNYATGSGPLTKEFFDFLKLWLSAHILHIDAKYGTFAKKTKAA